MTGREIISYISHFDLDSEVLFRDNNGQYHHVTDYSKEAYLGNGQYDTKKKQIIFQTTDIINGK